MQNEGESLFNLRSFKTQVSYVMCFVFMSTKMKNIY